MFKKIFVVFFITLFFLTNAQSVSAKPIRPSSPENCTSSDVCCSSDSGDCVDDGSYACSFWGKDQAGKSLYTCQKSSVGEAFGKVKAPDPIKGLLSNDPTGAGGINRFLSNLVTLFYSIAFVVLIFMLLWGAWDWLTSQGEKEKIHGAQQKIISAIIGVILFALTFAIIRVLGAFTGFKFFVGQ